MSVDNFIPKLWSARLNANLNKALVFGNVVNRDYEGEISQQGDSVNINQLGDITISDYNKSAGHGTPEELSSDQKTLIIDQAKSFAFFVHDADKVQANVALMDEAMRRASYNMADVVDQYIASLYTGVASDNTIGDDTSPVTLSNAGDAYDYIVDLGTKLDEANVPNMDRYVVIPAWISGMMKKDDRVLNATPEVLKTGAIGEIDGMLVYKSNNTPNIVGDGTNTFDNDKVIAGYKGAISFANQFVEVEAIRSGTHFADVVRGLNLYGAKLVQPEGIAVLSATK